jgi:hypothetical protein
MHRSARQEWDSRLHRIGKRDCWELRHWRAKGAPKRFTEHINPHLFGPDSQLQDRLGIE